MIQQQSDRENIQEGASRRGVRWGDAFIICVLLLWGAFWTLSAWTQLGETQLPERKAIIHTLNWIILIHALMCVLGAGGLALGRRALVAGLLSAAAALLLAVLGLVLWEYFCVPQAPKYPLFTSVCSGIILLLALGFFLLGRWLRWR